MGAESATTSLSWIIAAAQFIRANAPAVILVTTILTLFLAVLVWRRMRKPGNAARSENSGKNSEAETDAPKSKVAGGLSLWFFSLLSGVGTRNVIGTELALLQSFKNAAAALRALDRGTNRRHGLPLYLMVGPEAAGKSSMLQAAGLHLPLGEPQRSARLGNAACNWWVFENGVVIEPAAGVFGMPESGREPDRLWRQLARLFQWYRPRRPLDGVILCLPADHFAGVRQKSAHDLAEIGRLCNRRLSQIQRRLGISLPLYVVISKCDVVDGFAAFWQCLPSEKHGQLFGWSTPYNPDALFKEGWLDEAMAHIRDRLDAVRVEQAAIKTPGVDEDAFLFPARFQELTEPLKRCLKHVLHSTSSDDVRPFRGLYFSGDPERRSIAIDHAPIQRSGLGADEAAPAGPRPAMIADLLTEKVFREIGLVRPLASSLTVRNRQVRLAQAGLATIAIAGAAGLAWSSFDLHHSVQVLEPGLRDIRETILAQERRERRARLADTEQLGELRFFDERDTARLLEAMGRFETQSFGSVFMPTSLSSDINDRLAAFLSKGFDTVLMRAIYNQLNARAETALAKARDERERASGGQNATEMTSERNDEEVNRLNLFARELDTVERMAHLYNELSITRDLEHLSTLSRELFATQMPPQMNDVSHLVRAALARIDYRRFETEDYRSRSTARARQLIWDVHDRLFSAGALEQELLGLARLLNSFGESQSDPDLTSEEINGIETGIRSLQARVRSAEYSWAWNGELQIGPLYDESLKLIANSRFFDDGLAAEFIEAGNNDFDQFRARLRAYDSRLTGSLLEGGQGRTGMTVSSSVRQLAILIEELKAEPFMAVPPARQLVTRIGSGEWLNWDPGLLDDALKLYGDFDRYVAEELEGFPQEVRPKLFDLARARFALALRGRIAEAQQIESRGGRNWGEPERGSALERRVDNFAAAAPRLDRLIRIMMQFNVLETAQPLIDLAQWQAASLLFDVDQLLEREPAYEPRYAIDQWNGSAPATAAVYAFSDDVQARSYLNYQRERLNYLAQELARPLLDFLDTYRTGLSEQALSTERRWRAIGDELQKYDKRQADSAVAQLERFIRFDLAKIDKGNCVAATKPEDYVGSGRFASGSINYFIDRLQQIENLAFARCGNLVLDELIDRYNRIASLFNQRFAGRFPFAPADARNEADPRALDDFLRDHGDSLGQIYSELEALSNDPLALEGQFDFVEAMLMIKSFFERPSADGSEAPMIFERLVDADFRILRNREVMANHILDWQLYVGHNRIIDRTNKGPVAWRIGDPIALSLRWAANAPMRPDPYPERINAGPDSHFAIDGHAVNFTYEGDWALLRLIRHQRQSEMEGPANRPFLLGFSIETIARNEPEYRTVTSNGEPNSVVREVAQGFWRLSVLANENAQSDIERLPDFPDRAPLINSTAFRIER